MDIRSLFSTSGAIFGPAILGAGVLALCLCVWASRRSSSYRTRRLAVTVSVLPLAVAFCGAVFGFVLWQLADQHVGEAAEAWRALGQVCLAGLVVTSLPLLWAALLLCTRRGMA